MGYRIFFVITLEAGRIRPADVVTINLVITAIQDVRGLCYSVIINKVSPGIVKKLEKNENNEREDLMACLMGEVPHKTDNIYYMVQKDELFGTDMNKDSEDPDERKLQYTLPIELREFILEAPKVFIKTEEVQDVKESEFEKMQEEFEGKIKDLKDNLEAQQKENEKITQKLEEQKEQIKKDQEAFAAEMDRKNKEIQDSMAQQKADMEKLEHKHELDLAKQKANMAEQVKQGGMSEETMMRFLTDMKEQSKKDMEILELKRQNNEHAKETAAAEARERAAKKAANEKGGCVVC